MAQSFTRLYPKNLKHKMICIFYHLNCGTTNTPNTPWVHRENTKKHKSHQINPLTAAGQQADQTSHNAAAAAEKMAVGSFTSSPPHAARGKQESSGGPQEAQLAACREQLIGLDADWIF